MHLDPPAPDGGAAAAAPRRSRLRRLLGWALVAATLGFVGLTIARHRAELAAVDWRIQALPLLGSVALLLLALGWGIHIWGRILVHLGVRLPFPAALRIWFVASLARYVPGKVWQFVGAAQMGRAYGIGAVTMVTSLVLSTGYTMAASVVLGLPFLAFRFIESDAAATALSALGIAATLVAVHPRATNAALALVPRALHRDVLSWGASWGASIVLLLGSVVSWLMYGVAFTVFAMAVLDVDAGMVPAFIAVNAIAVLAGVAAIVAPAGLGAREVTLTVLLQPYLPTAGAAALLAVLARIWVIAAEVAGAALAVALARRSANGRRA